MWSSDRSDLGPHLTQHPVYPARSNTDVLPLTCPRQHPIANIQSPTCIQRAHHHFAICTAVTADVCVQVHLWLEVIGSVRCQDYHRQRTMQGDGSGDRRYV
jgi:hypothetical protein